MINIRGVYAILNSTTNKMYIGSSKSVMRRLGEHKSDLRKGRHYCKILQKDWTDSLEFGFTAKLLEAVPEEVNLFERERFHIESNTNLYNIHTPSSNGGITRQPKEVIDKIKVRNREEYLKNPSKFDEARQRSAETTKRRILEDDPRVGIAKKRKVEIFKDEVYLQFDSIKECATYIGVTVNRITECLVGFKHKGHGIIDKVHSIKGYKCKYLES